MDYVFGYGSLAATDRGDAVRATLRDHRRRWGVAMDNREAVSGYKRYVDAAGDHPPVHVAFLDLAPGEGAVNGVCRPVTSAQLAALDRRERNYLRVEATAQITPAPGRVWLYAGSPAGRARLARGRRSATAVVSREYLAAVVRGFAALGTGELARFHASSDLRDLPIAPLRRVELA